MKSLNACALTLFAGMIAGCSSGGGGGSPEPGTSTRPIVTQYAVDSQGRELNRFSMNRLQADNFYRTAGARTSLVQSVVNVGRDSFRVYVDPATQQMVRVDDLRAGTVFIVNYQADRTDYMTYSAAGVFQSGVALYRVNNEYRIADIVGTPGFQGQIDLSLGSFGAASLVAARDSGLANERAVDPRIVAFAAPLQKFEADFAKVSVTDPRVCVVVGVGAGVIAGLASSGFAGFMTGSIAIAACAMVQNQLRQDPELRDRFDRLLQGNLADDLASLADGLRSTIASGASAPSVQIPDMRTTADPPPVSIAAQPATPSSGPPASNSSVTGIAVDRDNTTYTLSGTVAANGTISVNGTSAQGPLTISGQLGACPAAATARFLETSREEIEWVDTGPLADRQPRARDAASLQAQPKATGTCVNGTFSARSGNGSLTGQTSPLGACQTVTSSGGQGTFSRAYNMGAASGSVTFSYDAFGIPDAFTVYNAGSVVFSTGGLVSGGASRSFPVTSASVFVTVSAPQDGTAWEFSLSCPT